MESFSISCTTCKSRLKVRDKSAVGQILSCPKCGSMVMVQPPSDAQGQTSAKPPQAMGSSPGVAGPTADAKLPLENTFEDAASMLSDEPPVAAGARSSGKTPDGKSPADKSPTKKSPTKKSPAGSPPAGKPSVGKPSTDRWSNDKYFSDTVEVPRPPEFADSKSVTPSSADPASKSDRPKQSSKPPQQQPAKSESGTSATSPVAATAAALKNKPPADSAASPSAAPSESLESVPADAQPVLPDANWVSRNARRWQSWLMMGGAAVGGIVLAVLLFGFILRPKPTTKKPPSKRVAKQDDKSTPQDNTSNKGDPPQGDPDKGDPNKGDPPSLPVTPKDPKDVPPVGENLKPDPSSDVPPDLAPPKEDPDAPKGKPDPKDFDEFAPLLDDLPFDVAPLPAGPKKDKPLLPPASLPGDGSRVRPAWRKIDIKARLADEVLGIEFENIALIDFLHFLTGMSTVPITIDPESLGRAGISADATVNVRLTETTVDALLEATLAQHDLSYLQDEGHIIVGAVADAASELRQQSYNVADLAGDDPKDVEVLGESITQLVAPASWDKSGGAGKIEVDADSLKIDQRDAVHRKVLLLLERLRVLRGIAPKSDTSPTLLKLQSPRQLAAEALKKPLKLNFILPTPLTRIFKQIHEQSGVRILVDWRAAAEAGWSPRATATLSADGKPLEQALTDILKPMGLMVRAIDENTIQVTSPQALATVADLEFHAIDDLLSKDLDGPALVAKVKTALGPHLFQDRGGIGTVIFDPPSKHLLVSLPQPWHVELEKHLAKWRSE